MDPATNLLRLIGNAEAESYDDVYAPLRGTTPKPLTQMTVDEVLAWQDAAVAGGAESSAAGQFQIIRKTLRGLKGELGLTGQERFDRGLQDRLALSLMKPALQIYADTGDVTAMGNALAQVWAGLPVLSDTDRNGQPVRRGESYYSGDGLNAATIAPEIVEDRLRALGVVIDRQSGRLNTLTATPERPGPHPPQILAARRVPGSELAPAFQSPFGGQPWAQDQGFWPNSYERAVLNPVVSWLGEKLGDRPVTERAAGYDPFARAKREGHMDMWRILRKATNDADYDWLLTRTQDRRQRMAALHEQAGIGSTLMGELLSPETLVAGIFIPGRIGLGFLRSGLKVGAVSAATWAPVAGLRYSQNPDLDLGDAALEVGLVGLFGGAIGGIFGAVAQRSLVRSQVRAAQAAVADEFAALNGVGAITTKLQLFDRGFTVVDHMPAGAPASASRHGIWMDSTTATLWLNPRRVMEGFKAQEWRQFGLDDSLFPNANAWREFMLRYEVELQQRGISRTRTGYSHEPMTAAEVESHAVKHAQSRVLNTSAMSPADQQAAAMSDAITLDSTSGLLIVNPAAQGKQAATSKAKLTRDLKAGNQENLVLLIDNEVIPDLGAWAKTRKKGIGAALYDEAIAGRNVRLVRVDDPTIRSSMLVRRIAAGADAAAADAALYRSVAQTEALETALASYKAWRSGPLHREMKTRLGRVLDGMVPTPFKSIMKNSMAEESRVVAELLAGDGTMAALNGNVGRTMGPSVQTLAIQWKQHAKQLKVAEDTLYEEYLGHVANPNIGGVAVNKSLAAIRRVRADGSEAMSLSEFRERATLVHVTGDASYAGGVPQVEAYAGQIKEFYKPFQKAASQVGLLRHQDIQMVGRRHMLNLSAMGQKLELYRRVMGPINKHELYADVSREIRNTIKLDVDAAMSGAARPIGTQPNDMRLALQPEYIDHSARVMIGFYEAAARSMGKPVREVYDMFKIDMGAASSRRNQPNGQYYSRSPGQAARIVTQGGTTEGLLMHEFMHHMHFMLMDDEFRALIKGPPFDQIIPIVDDWAAKFGGKYTTTNMEIPTEQFEMFIRERLDPVKHPHLAGARDFFASWARHIKEPGGVAPGGYGFLGEDFFNNTPGLKTFLDTVIGDDAALAAGSHLTARQKDLLVKLRGELQTLRSKVDSDTQLMNDLRAGVNPASQQDYFTRYYAKQMIGRFPKTFHRIMKQWFISHPEIEVWDDALGAYKTIIADPATLDDRVDTFMRRLTGEEPWEHRQRLSGGGTGPRSARDRDIAIPNQLLVGLRQSDIDPSEIAHMGGAEHISFIETDPMLVANVYSNQMGVEIEFWRRFADAGEGINGAQGFENAVARARAAEKAQWQKVNGSLAGFDDHWFRLERDMRMVKDRVLGRIVTDPSRWDNRTAKVARDYSAPVYMGMAGIISLMDATRMIASHGLSQTFNFALKMFDDKTRAGMKLAVGEADSAAGLFDVHLGTAQHKLTETGIEPLTMNGVERVGAWLAGKTYLFNLLSPITDTLRGLSGAIYQHEIIAAALRVGDGAGSARDDVFLRGLGLDASFVGWVKQAHREGKVLWDEQGKHWLANTDAWGNEGMVRRFRAGLLNALDNTILMAREADKPSIVSGVMHFKKGAATNRAAAMFDWTDVGGYWRVQSGLLGLPFMYLNYALAAATKVTTAFVENPNSRAMGAMVAMLGVGYMAAWLRTPDFAWEKMDGVERIAKGMDQSGFFGILPEIAWTAQSASMLAFGINPLPVKPRFGIDSPTDQAFDVLGPGATLARNALLGGYETLTGEPGGAHRLSLVAPFRNHFLVGGLIKDLLDFDRAPRNAAIPANAI